MVKHYRALIIFALIILIISVCKLFFSDTIFSTTFYVFEFITYLISIIFIYLFVVNVKRVENEKESFIDEQLNFISSLEDDKKKLLNRIDEYESRNIEEQKLDTYTTAVLRQLESEFKLEEYNYIEFSEHLFKVLSNNFPISGGLCYFYNTDDNCFKCQGKYAVDSDTEISDFKIGEGLNGQVVEEGKLRVIKDIPSDYLKLSSGLGEALPIYLYLLPISKGNNIIGLIELSTFKSIRIDMMWEEIDSKLDAFLSELN